MPIKFKGKVVSEYVNMLQLLDDVSNYEKLFLPMDRQIRIFKLYVSEWEECSDVVVRVNS